jgi:acyl-CoA thioesterase-1
MADLPPALRWTLTTTFLVAVSATLNASTKVACVGDSITEGIGLGDRTYPAKLGQLLGLEYEVRNFGISGRTLLKQGDYPYWTEPVYAESLSWQPDIVVIKLGTNDSKPQNWIYSDQYVPDYEELIASYTNLPSRPLILLATPCPVYGSGAFDIDPTVVADEIAPAVRAMAARLGHRLIDYQERMAGHQDWFPDNVHPNAAGTTVMAALACQVILDSDPASPPPTLTLRQPPTGPPVLEWPTADAGYVLEERYSFSGGRARWMVFESVTLNTGITLRAESINRTRSSFYRLRRP